MKILSSDQIFPLLRFSPGPGSHSGPHLGPHSGRGSGPESEKAATDGYAVFTLMELEQIVGEGMIDGEGRGEDQARRIKRPLRMEAGEPAGRTQGEGDKRSGKENPGWWELTSGVYLARVNERLALPSGALLLLQPHPHMTCNGVWHLPFVIRAEKELEEEIMLVVSVKGVRIRENAPLSRGIVFFPGT